MNIMFHFIKSTVVLFLRFTTALVCIWSLVDGRNVIHHLNSADEAAQQQVQETELRILRNNEAADSRHTVVDNHHQHHHRLQDDFTTQDSSVLDKYSIFRYEQCRQFSKLNNNFQNNASSSFSTTTVVEFSRCPITTTTTTISSSQSKQSSQCAPCQEDGGRYAVDLAIFARLHLEARETALEDSCAAALQQCHCSNAACFQQCFFDAGREECMFSSLERFLNCAALDDGLGYVGPYCDDDGVSIRFAIFSDSSCTTFAADKLPEQHNNSLIPPIPYQTTTSLLHPASCFACSAAEHPHCQETYDQAVKCETNIRQNLSNPDETGCALIQSTFPQQAPLVIKVDDGNNNQTMLVWTCLLGGSVLSLFLLVFLVCGKKCGVPRVWGAKARTLSQPRHHLPDNDGDDDMIGTAEPFKDEPEDDDGSW